MLKNYVLVAIRNLRRERLYAVINIVGLAIGLGICLLVMAYVVDEWNFDNFHANGDRLYRANKLVESASEDLREASTPFPLGEFLGQQVPEIDQTVRVIPMLEGIVSANHRAFRESISFADQNFFDVFTFPLRVGDSATALNDLASVVISASMAERLFGKADPIGQRVRLDLATKSNEFVVTGVAEDSPANSSLKFTVLATIGGLGRFINVDQGWGTSWPETYVLLKPNANIDIVGDKLATLGNKIPRVSANVAGWGIQLQEMDDIHLDPDVSGTAANVSSPTYSTVLALIGLVILELACINFTTLSIGRAQRRVREMGVRKVSGAGARQITGQILGETAVIAVISLLVAFVLAELLLPHFGSLTGKQFDSLIQSMGWWNLLLVWLVVITTLCAGGYPALIMSRIKSIEAVGGKARFLTGRNSTRGLVVLQFVISAALIAVVLSMSNQINYALTAPLGFNRESLLMVGLSGTGAERLATVERLRQSLTHSGEVVSVSASGTDFSGGGVRIGNRVGPDSSSFTAFINAVDPSYITTMGLELIEGNDFPTVAGAQDGYARVIVNETFVREMKWQDAIGREMPLMRDSRIVGVVRDFHIQPFNSLIEPVALVEANLTNDLGENLAFALVRLGKVDVAKAVWRIENVWQEIAPQYPFDYEFMDAHIESQYRAYTRWADIVRDSTLVAVAIAAFGVFGLTALAISRRRKELGIRRILGARTIQLVSMFYREFAVLVVAGNLIAIPIAYWSVQHWLSGFVYRAAISPLPFFMGLALLLGIVIITVSLQAFKASSTNVSEVIRYE